MPVDDLLTAACAAIGSPLTDPIDLGGSTYSTVLRCRDPVRGTVIVKSYPQTADGAQGFTAEAAGLALTSDAEVAPGLLAVDPAARLIVMTDLGDSPSLADVLLGGSAAQAEDALLSWALACGQLAVRTAGRQGELAVLRAAYPAAAAPASSGADLAAAASSGAGTDLAAAASSGSGDGAAHWMELRVRSVPGLLGGLDLGLPPGLGDDLDVVVAIARPGDCEVFSPGDICPDNNLLTPAGIRFIDFESAEFHSGFLDAAYLRMPFSSCWCVFRLPDELAAAAEAVYRAELCRIFPELASDEVWLPGLRLANAAWTLHAMSYLLDRSVIADRSMHDGRAPVPTARQLLRYRWARLREDLASAAELPSICALMGDLIAATRDWQVPDLPVYPAFR